MSFEEKLQEIGRFDSRQLEGVWWMPSQQAESRIVLTNTSDETLSVTAQLSKRPAQVGNSQIFELAPHQTRVLNLRQDFNDGNQFANGNAVGISLQHSGAKSALVARALVGELQTGYSMVVPFSNPSVAKSSKYDGAGLQLESIEGERLKPVAVVRNIGTAASTVTAKATYTRTDGTRNTVTLPQVTLNGKEIKLMNVQQLVQRADSEDIKVAGIEISYNTAPGSVITQVQSAGEQRDYVFRVVMWDALAQRSSTGTYPWFTDETSTTKAYIKNTTALEQRYLASITWENGGRYIIGSKTVAAGETIEIDVKKLRDEQTPDQNGNTIPLAAVRGQIDWSIRVRPGANANDRAADLALVGQMEQTDFVNKFSSHYFCQSCCNYNPSGGNIQPYGVEIEVDETRNYQVFEAYANCYGSQVGSYTYAPPSNPVTWSNNNPGVAAVGYDPFGAVVGGVSPGAANISASWTTYSYYSNSCNGGDTGGGYDCGICYRNPDFVRTVNTSVTVKPKVTISESQTKVDGEDASFSVTVQGGTPSSIQWSFEAPSGAGNNPQVNFNNPNAASVTAKAHWFASPNRACPTSPGGSDGAPLTSRYKIKARVNFSSGSPITKETSLTVTLPALPGRVDGNNGITGFPSYKQDTRTGIFSVTGIGTLRRTRNVTKNVFVPQTSQFFNKVDRHEDVHVGQYQPGGILAGYYDANNFYARIRNFTASSLTGLQQRIQDELDDFLDDETAAVLGQCNASEVPAYQVSDALAPQYLYQSCGRTTFPNCPAN